MTNRLASETSPYLLQHKDNPVEWYPWGEEALQRARQLDRPILLSIGYSSCHWCHVMAHQSFENPGIAQEMNEHFVNIKVDREERPDIDAIYMTALQSLTGQGGWPLNIFLTPEGVPFFGGTYWPPSDTGGMPGFPRVLEAVQSQWQHNRDAITTTAGKVRQVLEQSTAFLPSGGASLPGIPEAALGKLQLQFDPMHGGFSGAPKFPQSSLFTFLLRHHRRTGSPESLTMVTTTLDRMADGGIHDQLGGGFSRYSVDALWLVPHFEKMLYDNAQLLQAYLDAWRITGHHRYQVVAEHLIDWLLREMTDPAGGFFAALDADSEGEEGRFYTWSGEEIDDVLTVEEADLARIHYGTTAGGQLDGRNVLHVARSAGDIATGMGQTEDSVVEAIETVRSKLFAARALRIRPGTDTKIIVGWNGLMIASLAQAAIAFDRPDVLQAAIGAATRMVDQAIAGRPSLARQVGVHGGSGTGLLEDHAFLAQGLLHLHAATGDVRWLESGRDLAIAMLERFRTDVGFYDTAFDAEQLIVRPRDLQDGATPSGTSVALDVLLTLYDLTLDDRFLEPVAPVLEAWSMAMAEHPAAFGYMLAVLERTLGDQRQLVLVGGDYATAFRSSVLRRYEPFLTIAWSQPNVDPATWPVLAERPLPTDAVAAAYVCQGYACLPPLTDEATLVETLARELPS